MLKKKLYEGKAKIIYRGKEPNTLIQYFKDDATAFNNKIKAVIEYFLAILLLITAIIIVLQ